MSNTTKNKNENVIVKSEVVKRIPHFIKPTKEEGKTKYFIQAVYADGDLRTIPTTKKVWEKIRGNRSGDEQQKNDLGIRGFAACDYLLHFNSEKCVVGVDIIPSRYFVRGAAPIAARNAVRKGFLLYWHEDMNGFELKNESLSERDVESNTFFRVGYTGLTQRVLIDLLSELRKSNMINGSKKSATILNHRIALLEPELIRVIPTDKAIPKEGRLNS